MSIEDELEQEILSLSHDEVKRQLRDANISPCNDSELEEIFIEVTRTQGARSS